jgi:5-formyltetrahydrofolate cyclo-ligase
LAESLEEYLPDSRICRADGKDTVEKKAVFLMGMLADKDYHAVIDIISPFAAGFVCLTPDSPRALPAEKLAAELEERGFSARPCGTAAEGIETALCLAGESFSRRSHAGQDAGRALPVVAFGSLYMAGHVRSVFSSVLQKHLALSKKKQRKAALQRRRALTAAERAGKSSEICRILASMPQLQEAETILSYAATWDEADPWEINCLLQARGKTVCYPLTEENGRMTAVIPGAKGAALKEQPAQERESDQGGQPALERKSDRGEQPALERESDQGGQPAQERESAGHFSDSAIWKTGVYGIREPVKELALEVDPSRIDAVIVPCVVFDQRGGRCGHGAGYYDRFLTKVKPSAAKILIAFDAQESGEVPMEKTDIRMDFAVTESGLIAFGAGARPLTPCF